MITIACPKCSAKLRVDPAYQGLTCRCTHCQSLLAIPSDAARMPVRLAAEGAEGSGARRSASTASGSSRSGSSRGSSRSGTQLQDVYSGNGSTAPALNVVQPPHEAAAPTQLISLQDRGSRGGSGGHQAAILAGAIGAGVLILTLGVVIVVMITSKAPPAGPATAYASTERRSLFQPEPEPAATPPLRVAAAPAVAATPEPAKPAEAPEDPDNPMGWNTPTVLRQPIAGHTAVLVDAVEQSRGWIDDVNATLLATLSRNGDGEKVSVFYVHDGEVSRLPRQPLAPGRALRASLAKLQEQAPAAGRKGFYDGLHAALGARPDHVIVITGRREWDKAADYVLGRVTDAPSKPTFSVVSLGGPNADLDRITAATGGELDDLSPRTVRSWVR
ncbi:zinc ribbon domain-containing protein [Phycisphaera mikurensis]|uniref:Uncharacterized protein n=1 Tax=Phycisphaera mikurensis (strain NBRC 102666 / KCTC 22515 / FYK2301M01) TaxID=1142394 RepID=I0ICF5_PHYMF|nr:hypothetical protein [Phycisphaera mikurensis]MBB6442181.1 hypothetical protein [Phycisphaera mikurensis]BAM02943.1 hypothetical protein PSMK_07840 [Phycisphaera mikurensis NBRC 102666]